MTGGQSLPESRARRDYSCLVAQRLGIRPGAAGTGIHKPLPVTEDRSAIWPSSPFSRATGVQGSSVYTKSVFEWDPRKAKANADKHGVPFDEAVTIFLDADALDGPDL